MFSQFTQSELSALSNVGLSEIELRPRVGVNGCAFNAGSRFASVSLQE